MDKFVEYLEKYNGIYSADDVLVIAGVYKLIVPQHEKDWQWLATALGCEYSGEALRKRVGRYFAMFPDAEDSLLKDFDNKTRKEKRDDIQFQIDSLYKKKVQTQDLIREYRSFLREDARIDHLKECITEAAKSVETYVPNRFIGEEPENIYSEAVLLLSDWHIGADVNNFYNKYNAEIANKYLDRIVNDTIDYCKKFGIFKLNILNLGDLIHGSIHTNMRINQEFDVITQIEVAAQMLYKALSRLESAAPVVTYRSCSDNHARLMANKSEHIEKENFGRLIDWWIEAKLQEGGHNILMMDDNLDFGLGKFELLNGKTVMFSHGHEDNINTAYQNFTGATKQFVDYICLAHYHNPKEKSFQDCKVIVNGSLVGTEQFALSKRLFASPCQKLLIFDNNFVDISLSVK